MRKLLPLVVVGIFVLSGLGAVAGTESEIENFESETITFSQPIIREKTDFVEIELSEATSDSWETDKPKLPVVTEVFTFPLGTIVDSVDVTFSNPIEKEISKPIQPAPTPVMKSALYSSDVSQINNDFDYSGINVYPEQRYTYRTSGGLKGEEHVTYLAVSVFPVQYNPGENTISYSEKATIEVSYTTATDGEIVLSGKSYKVNLTSKN